MKDQRAGRYGALSRNFRKREPASSFNGITEGFVVDTNDPQQMGRLRVWCPSLGDNSNTNIGDIPWATYMSPLGGFDRTSTRGRGDDTDNISIGPIAYGMWNIPNEGASVVVTCLDGDMSRRIWMGCIHGQYFPHTLPHGRFLDGYEGPQTSEEQPIYPLYVEQAIAFNNQLDSHEYASRGANKQAAALDDEISNSDESVSSTVKDSAGTGYRTSRSDPDALYDNTAGNLESSVYSWTTPGFHSISMEDAADGCRIRVRSTHGAQVLIDDTNERIYIQSAKGNTWIEMDEAGNIDIFGQETVSVRSRGDVNITADKAVRIAGKEGVHISSNGVFRASAGTIDLKSVSDMVVESTSSTLTLKASAVIDIEGSGITNTASGAFGVTAGTGDMSFSTSFAFVDPLASLSGGNYFGQSFATSSISMTSIASHTHPYTWTDPGGAGNTSPGSYSGGGAGSASPPGSTAGTAQAAYFSNRVPDHEPFARQYLDLSLSDNDGSTLSFPADGNFLPLSEYDYESGEIGRGSQQRGIVFDRNDNWRR